MRKSFVFNGLALVAVIVGTAFPTSLEAQRRRTTTQNLKRLLIIPPLPATSADSAFSIEFTDQFRDRASGKLRNQMRVFDTEEYCEALAASGFECGTILDNNSAEQLANFMSADAYIVGVLSATGTAPHLEMRLVNARRSGLAGLAAVPGVAGMSPRDFADQAADSVRNQARAASDVRDCGERRDRGDLEGARERAQRAFERYPNHPAGALCVAYLFEATNQPADSLIWAYNKVVAGDPANSQGWDRLARLYIQEGDTVSGIIAFSGKLEADPRDHDLRIQIAGMWNEVDSLARALAVLEEAVEYDLERFLQAQVAFCVDAEAWACVLDKSERRFQADSSLGTDRDFVQSMMAAADFAADTVAALRWTGIAARSFPDDVALQQNHAGWLKGANMTDSALTIFTALAERDPSNTNALLAIVSTMQDRYVIDSVTPVDSVALTAMDSLLMVTTAAAGDQQATLTSIGSLYLRPGIGYAQLNLHPRLAATWLAKSLEYPLPPTVVAQASFFLGIMTPQYLTDVFAEVRAAETCAAVDDYEAHVVRGKTSLMRGRGVAPEYADRFLEQQYPPYEAVIPQFRDAWDCTGPAR